LDLAQIRLFGTRNFQTEFESCLEVSLAWSDALALKKGITGKFLPMLESKLMKNYSRACKPIVNNFSNTPLGPPPLQYSSQTCRFWCVNDSHAVTATEGIEKQGAEWEYLKLSRRVKTYRGVDV
jgi:hypothetical protein